MRTLPFCLLLASVLGLGGCASAPPVGFCAGVSDLQQRQQWAAAVHGSNTSVSVRLTTVAHHKLPPHVEETAMATKDDAPEPRPTSTEWWMRENIRVGKAIIICRGCLAAAIANPWLPKPAVLSSTTDLPARPTSSIDRFDEEPTEPPGEH
jgi:hypothetical protein